MVIQLFDETVGQNSSADLLTFLDTYEPIRYQCLPKLLPTYSQCIEHFRTVAGALERCRTPHALKYLYEHMSQSFYRNGCDRSKIIMYVAIWAENGHPEYQDKQFVYQHIEWILKAFESTYDNILYLPFLVNINFSATRIRELYFSATRIRELYFSATRIRELYGGKTYHRHIYGVTRDIIVAYGEIVRKKLVNKEDIVPEMAEIDYYMGMWPELYNDALYNDAYNNYYVFNTTDRRIDYDLAYSAACVIVTGLKQELANKTY